MENKMDFSKLLHFFREKPPALPGESEYNAKFCKTLLAVSSAEAASIWQLDSTNQLHPIYGTNFTSEEVRDVILREGEGIGGAVVESRQAIGASQMLSNARHDQRVDKAIGFRTLSMISAPILFGGQLYGVINILNHTSGKEFPLEWQVKLSTAGIMYAAALAAAGQLLLYDESSSQSGISNRKVTQFSKYKTVVIGASCSIQDVLQLCVKAARSDIPVLIRGETGTGKELAARRIHEAGNRASGPFIEMNCAAITEALLESELFGHVKGAFSGATDSRKGKFLAASGGTLFLDEIGNMSPTFQAKILRVLQEMKFCPVGSEKTVTCDIRIVTATNQDLWEKVRDGSFREDLFYRLCGIEIVMPSLRERCEDIPLLVQYFLNRFSVEQKKRNPLYQSPKMSKEALEMLMAFRWPGNVRQLEQAVLASIAICETDEISDFPVWFENAISTGKEKLIVEQGENGSLPVETTSTLDKVDFSYQERLRYLKALESTKYRGTGRWNKSAAAEYLSIPRKTFEYNARKMGLIPQAKPQSRK
jgi:Nif-specific regulatory protein